MHYTLQEYFLRSWQHGLTNGYARWPTTTAWHCNGHLSRRWTQSSASKNTNQKKFKAYPRLICPEPKKEKADYISYTSNTGTLDVFRKHYIVWSMMKSQLDIEKLVHTRVAYNPLLKVNLQVSTKFSSLQVINGSPTDWLNLNTAIKIVQNINIICALQEKTIVSLDMQLCAKCIQLQSKKEISNNFLFWLFKALGRYINNSGLDQAFA